MAGIHVQVDCSWNKRVQSGEWGQTRALLICADLWSVFQRLFHTFRAAQMRVKRFVLATFKVFYYQMTKSYHI